MKPIRYLLAFLVVVLCLASPSLQSMAARGLSWDWQVAFVLVVAFALRELLIGGRP